MEQLFIYLMLNLIMLLLVNIMILVAVAFLTLFERKILSYIQLRKGPNKVGFSGILQPFSDAVKLLSKEMINLLKFNYLYYLLSPVYMLLLMMMMWLVYPFLGNMMSLELGFMYLIFCFSLSVYGLLMTGWSSNSFYAMLGAIRSLSQSISYEVNLSLIILGNIMMIESFNLGNINIFQKNLLFMLYMWPLMLVMFISLMAEMNRTPFDFSEGESELVSGFNVEYMSGGFVLIFLSEYSSILFVSYLIMYIYMGNNYMLIFYLFMMFMNYMIIWLRGTMPRFRYDLLMYLCWMIILPFILNYLYYLMIFKFMIYKKDNSIFNSMLCFQNMYLFKFIIFMSMMIYFLSMSLFY